MSIHLYPAFLFILHTYPPPPPILKKMKTNKTVNDIDIEILVLISADECKDRGLIVCTAEKKYLFRMSVKGSP